MANSSRKLGARSKPTMAAAVRREDLAEQLALQAV
jgi:hypothetical protein